jgi:thioredoxin reductase (NADPH)
MQRFHEHCQEYGLQIVQGEVQQLNDKGEIKEVVVDGRSLQARAVIVATGAEPRKLGIPGEAELVGRGVSYCATCDGAFFRNVPVAVVGGGDTAAEEALFLSRFASKVYLVHRRDALRATRILQERIFANDKIEVVWDSLPEQVMSDNRGVNGLEVKNKFSGEKSVLEVEGVFFAIGVIPKAHFLADVLDLNEDGYIVTDTECRTSIPGVFAAGDVRNKTLKQIATAVGDGAVAAITAEKYLDEL